ncbi:MAG: LytR/AlgR family response regulator transcription factor [Sodaliphilus sp.]
MLKCVAIDDEPIALAILSQYCAKYGNIELQTFTSPVLGMARVKAVHPDVVFLDIELNGVSGLQFAKELPENCALIFTTAYAHYALNGFEANAIDFLHKPFFYERFTRAMQKVEHWCRMNDLLRFSDSEHRQITVKADYKNVPISVDRILFVESVDNYVRIQLVDGASVMSKMPLSTLMERLPEQEFLRIHRSYIVSINRIVRFSATEVVMDGKSLPIGKKYAEIVKQKLKI